MRLIYEMQKLLLKICCTEWVNESRDKRELSVCRELGMKVLVVAKYVQNAGSPCRNSNVVDGFDVVRFSSRPLGKYVPNSINRIISVFIWGHKISKLHPDIISGHDITGLLVGWISTCFLHGAKKPKLVYDSHELELGRNAKRSRLHTWCIACLEHFLINRSVFSIVVNDEIAKELQNMYKLDKRPIVVRSTPPLWKIDMEEIYRIRNIWNEQFAVGENSFIVMYHGAVMEGRGIETLIQLVALNRNINAVVLGNGEKNYIATLEQMCLNLNVDTHVLFHQAVDIKDLWKYVGAADTGFIIVDGRIKSYMYSLPNKFFENIQSETPIVCPNYPALKPIVDKYQIGLTCDPNDINEINNCVERMRTDKEFYAQCKANLKIAKQELCWENESKILRNAYEQLLKDNHEK